MRIAIDLNDTLRSFTTNFIKYYEKEFDVTIDESAVLSNDFKEVFPFKNESAYNKFVYEDYPLELFGASCPPCHKDLPARFNDWLIELTNLDVEEEIEVICVSANEYNLSIPASYFFLSKTAAKFRKIIFPRDSSTIWDECDILITANPKLIKIKPPTKKLVKITAPYNKDIGGCDCEFDSLMTFIENNDNIIKLIENDNL